MNDESKEGTADMVDVDQYLQTFQTYSYLFPSCPVNHLIQPMYNMNAAQNLFYFFVLAFSIGSYPS